MKYALCLKITWIKTIDNQYVDGKINASQQRVLTTKWVGEAWSKVGKMKDSVISSFKK